MYLKLQVLRYQPCLVEQTGGRCSVLSYVGKNMEKLPLEHGDRVIQLINHLSKNKTISITDMLYLSNVFYRRRWIYL